MSSGRWRHAIAALVSFNVLACAPLTDEVFTPLGLLSSSPVVVEEGAGVVEIPLRLTRPRDHAFSLAYHLVGIDAQDDCEEPDFEAADGRVVWPAGTSEASVPIWVGDDELAERDERLELRFDAVDTASVTPLDKLEVVIADDDRSALLDASELGVLPDVAGDQSVVLQATLDGAAKLGRAVVVMAPGDYEISSVKLSPGTTLSAYGVRWHRPALSSADTVSLRVLHEGQAASPPSLVEGLSIDGRREEQGPYRDHEREHAHLVELDGDPKQGGALRASFERLVLSSGTGSGLFIGPDSDVTVCHWSASELWRDALTLDGGGTRLRVRDLDATATQGTGLWLGARAPGFGESYQIDVDAEDVSVGAGDVEIEVSEGSQVVLRRLTMTEPPFRLDASGGSVRIEDSVLALAPPGLGSSWAIAHDVEVIRSTLVAFGAAPGEDAPLGPAAVSVTTQSFLPGPSSPGPGHLSFTECHFELGAGVAPDHAVYAIENAEAGTSVAVASCQLGAGFTDWFASKCSGCVLTP
jgi:hypothetical protein